MEVRIQIVEATREQVGVDGRQLEAAVALVHSGKVIEAAKSVVKELR
jgi:hypothetical protein